MFVRERQQSHCEKVAALLHAGWGLQVGRRGTCKFSQARGRLSVAAINSVALVIVVGRVIFSSDWQGFSSEIAWKLARVRGLVSLNDRASGRLRVSQEPGCECPEERFPEYGRETPMWSSAPF